LKIPSKEVISKVVYTRTLLDDDEKEFVDDDANNNATIEEKCPSCGHNKMYFTTAQTRSADEGATVFYRCVKCGYKFTSNN